MDDKARVFFSVPKLWYATFQNPLESNIMAYSVSHITSLPGVSCPFAVCATAAETQLDSQAERLTRWFGINDARPYAARTHARTTTTTTHQRGR